MKLARLLLQAFGPFTDVVIDFAASSLNLHLIYGPNEAGKSSALRAMTDLRFGIHLRSTDDFVHNATDLRIGGVFMDDQGTPIGFVRRKGRGQTLSRFDPARMQFEEHFSVLPEHERALTSGLERAEFEQMFGLNHARLREGGTLLLKGEGELGAALFEASAGTRGIAALLGQLDADAKKLYNPHGGALNATINQASRQINEQRQVLRQSVTKPTDWQALYRTHKTAQAKLDEVTQVLETLRRRENEIAELRTVEPLLREHDRAARELESLSGVPDLPDTARDERIAAEQAFRRAAKDLAEAELELRRCDEGLGRLEIEQPLLDHADAIERLAAGVEAAIPSRNEVQEQQAVIERLDAELALTAGRIAEEEVIAHMLASRPSDADRAELDEHLRSISRLEERLNGYRIRADELEEASKIIGGSESALPPFEARQTLVGALRQAQDLGSVSQQLEQIARDLGDLEMRTTQALSDLAGVTSLEELRKMQPLLDAQVLAARQDLSAIDEAMRTAKDDDNRIERDLSQQRLRHRELEAEGEVVTAETLRQARERRDQGWALVREAYVERSQSPDDLSSAFDPDQPLPDAFEEAQNQADRQADLLRADAKRAAVLEESTARIEAMDTRRQLLATELSDLAARKEVLGGHWFAQLAKAGLPPLEADALREWQANRQAALETAERLERSRADMERLRAKALASATALASALRAVGETPRGNELAPLIDQAVRWETQATQIEAEQRASERTEQERLTERSKVAAQMAPAEAELKSRSKAVQAWQDRLLLPKGSSAEAVRARLGEFDTLDKQAAALRDARERQARHRTVIDDSAMYANQVASLLGEPRPGLVDDFADRLRNRLHASREQDQRRRDLRRDQERADAIKRQAEREREALSATLASLCSAAGVDAAERLPEREEAAARKRHAREALQTQKQQLMKASTRPIDELRARLVDQDAIALDSERRRIQEEISQREEEQTSSRTAEEQARRALEAIDASDRAAIAREAMESAAAKYRAAIRPWARLRLAHALLQEALNRFRERAQAPMVAAASTYFSVMTGGRYIRLVTDEADDKPILRAERSDGVRIGVEAMSEGTADQLYLALRLAALDLRRRSHPGMPLVLDDVLITSDDNRAANVLKALAQFSEGGQACCSRIIDTSSMSPMARWAIGSRFMSSELQSAAPPERLQNIKLRTLDVNVI